MTSSNADTLTLTSSERASYLRATELLEPTGIKLEVAAGEFAVAKKALGSVPLSQAVDFYIQRHGVSAVPRSIEDVVVELFAAKKSDGLSDLHRLWCK